MSIPEWYHFFERVENEIIALRKVKTEVLNKTTETNQKAYQAAVSEMDKISEKYSDQLHGVRTTEFSVDVTDVGKIKGETDKILDGLFAETLGAVKNVCLPAEFEVAVDLAYMQCLREIEEIKEKSSGDDRASILFESAKDDLVDVRGSAELREQKSKIVELSENWDREIADGHESEFKESMEEEKEEIIKKITDHFKAIVQDYADAAGGG